ncbi:MAG: thioredoxin domain-containing protein [Flammeovirgaceae bacterium]
MNWNISKNSLYQFMISFLALVVFAATSIGLFVIFSQENLLQPNTSKSNSSSQNSSANLSQNKASNLPTSGKYTDYNNFDIKSESAKVANPKIILFFSSVECLSCKSLERDIEREITTIPFNVFILRVDTLQNKELADKYQVLLPNTFVQINSDQKEIRKWDYSYNFTDLIKEINKLN